MSLEQIRHECPWFFAMRELAGNRPNVVTVGIGNSRTPLDLTVLEPDGNDRDDRPGILNDTLANEILYSSENEEKSLRDADTGTSDGGNTSRIDDLTTQSDHEDTKPATIGRKRKFGELSSPDVKPDVKPNIKPSKAPKPGKRSSRLEEFANAVEAEEMTRQKEIDLARVRIEVAGKVKIEAQKATLELKRQEQKERSERREMRQKLEMARLTMKHEKAMARLNRYSHGLHPVPAHQNQAPQAVASSSTNPQVASSSTSSGYRFYDGSEPLDFDLSSFGTGSTSVAGSSDTHSPTLFLPSRDH